MHEIGGHPLLFLMVYGVAQMLALGAMGLMGYYTYNYSGSKGVDWEKNPGSFHPLFMTIGLIYCYAQGMLVFRIFRHRKKPALKLFHFFLQATAFICVVVGLKAEFNSVTSGVHAHSLHSWMGLGTVSLFACQSYSLYGVLTFGQYIIDQADNNLPLHEQTLRSDCIQTDSKLSCGFITFLFPGLQLRYRQFYLPIHTFFGVAIFIMAVATAMMGVTQKIIWLTPEDFLVFQPSSTVLKCYALVIALLALALAYGVANPQFKRVPLPEENPIDADIDGHRDTFDNESRGSAKRRQVSGRAEFDSYEISS